MISLKRILGITESDYLVPKVSAKRAAKPVKKTAKKPVKKTVKKKTTKAGSKKR